MGCTQCCVAFSGLRFRFRFPSPVGLMTDFRNLQCPDDGQVDEEFAVRLLTTPLALSGKPVATYPTIQIYKTDEGWLRIFTPLTAEDGCQVACLLCPDGLHKLYYPASRWHEFSPSIHLTHLIGGEALLLKHDAFLLHSSVVMINGKMVLFSGPSGAGKSTQADLWVKHRGAEVINGDRCVVMRKNGLFYGGGSPWSGTSGIYRPEQAPIAGIFLVHQASENSLERLGARAFPPLFTQTIVSPWDGEFMEKITRLFSELLSQIPVYRLNCRPDEDAVRLVYDTLFQAR